MCKVLVCLRERDRESEGEVGGGLRARLLNYSPASLKPPLMAPVQSQY